MSKLTVSLSTKRRVMLAFTMASTVALSGCLTSPYYGQKFDSRYVNVPFQFWTTDRDQLVTLECGKASGHGGLLDGQSYQPMTTMRPSRQPHYDYKSGDHVIYQASKKHVIPVDCWRSVSFSGEQQYITVIRITQGSKGDSSVYTYNRTGLKCLGEWAGFQGFFSSLGKGCEMKWRGTDDPIRTLFLKAKA